MKSNAWLLRPMALAVGSCFGISTWANPLGPQVVQGSATFQGLGSNNLQVSNAPGTVINWQGFSIGPGQITNFIQQNAASAVLNRVVGSDISRIHGTLQSNGRVFLINPAGIVIGATGIIDTAGFVGSTLNMLDADFLAGKLRFQGGPNAGSIDNQGTIRTAFGGTVVLVAPHIQNGKDALIQTPGGELILAAGQKVTIGTLDANGVQFEVQAPTDSVVNLGKLIAQGGAVGVFAGTLKHSGDNAVIRADALVRDEAGRVVLKAQSDVAIDSAVAATGRKGGDITVLGDRITISSGAKIDASGRQGGGSIRVGGDYRGANPLLTNASTTTVESGAALAADASSGGDGGRIIVWSDKSTRFEGGLSARGGAGSGNGGFAEVSGKENLFFAGSADLGAANGALGTLLLDPVDLFIRDAGGVLTFKDKNGNTVAFNPLDSAALTGNAVTVAPGALDNLKANVSLFASRYMLIDGAINLTTPGAALTAQVGTFTAGSIPGTPTNQLDIAQNITTSGGAVALSAPLINSLRSATIATGGGAVSLSAPAITASALAINAGSGALSVSNPSTSGNASLGALTFGNLTLDLKSIITGAISTGSLNITLPQFISTGAITTTGPVSLTGSSVSTGLITTNGGDVTATATSSFVNIGGATAGAGNVTLAGTSVSGGTIDTTGAVKLTATGSTVSARVNNAASVEATSTTTDFRVGASVNIASDTALNANNLNATATGCSGPVDNACAGATVTVNAAGNINVGSIVASAPVTTPSAAGAVGNKSATVSITSQQGSILAMNAASQVRATNVTLATGQGSGGGIGTAALALNADVERSLAFRPNGNFKVLLNGSGPNVLSITPGVAATGQTYSGTLAKAGGGIDLSVTATDTTVTVPTFTVTGFNQAVFNTPPSIALNVPNGALVVNSMTVPQGDTSAPVPPATTPATQPLSVTVSASGDLTVTNYTRQSTAASLPKSTAFSSSFGNVTLGTIAASKDAVSISAGNNISISSLTTAGSVQASTFFGNIAVGQIDTTSGSGAVTLSGAKVAALNDTVALDVLSGSPISITAATIGEAAFNNPLDVAAPSVTLTSTRSTAGQIGFAGRPVVANTPNLTINAFDITTGGGAKFNVSTGSTPLTNLTVSASPSIVGTAGPAQVRSESGTANDRTYSFVSDGTNFSFAAGNVPASQFVNGKLTFTSSSGNIALGDSNMGATGSLELTAPRGSITGSAVLDGKSIVLTAGTSGTGPVAINTGNIGSTNTSTITLASGTAITGGSIVGSIRTGALNSAPDGTIGLTAIGGNIDIGPTGTADIGSAAARAGAVTLESRNASTGGTSPVTSSGRVRAGNVVSKSLSMQSLLNDVTAGNIDATGNVTILSHNNVSTGTLDADRITISNEFFLSKFPMITVGTIGGVRPPSRLELIGDASTAGANAVTLLGPVTGAAGSSLLIAAGHLGAGPVVLGGPVTAAAGGAATIEINHQADSPFQFARVDAAAGGTVRLISRNGIQQTSDAAGSGVTADTVFLSSNAGSITNSADPAGRLDLNTVKSLEVTSKGSTALDAHGNTLTGLSITRQDTTSAVPFELANLGGGQVVTVSSGPTDMTLVAQSPSLLNLTVRNQAGALTLGAGIVTSGGNVTLATKNGIVATSGIVTGGAAGGGAINVSAGSGNLTTGTIDTTPTGTGTGGAITLAINDGTGNIVLGGAVRTGTGGGAIDIANRGTGDVTRTGTASISSPASVTVMAAAGSIGSAAAPLLITTPKTTLESRSAASAGSGFTFANLSGANELTMRADNGFNVASDTGFAKLSLNTRGEGTGTPGAGTLNLAATGQVYAFDRPTTDMFGAPITAFQVVTAAGASPAPEATFNALSGNLIVMGGASLTSPTLHLGTLGGNGDVFLQGTAASPLVLTNTKQDFSTPRDLVVRGKVSLDATEQTLFATRDLLVTGNAAFTGIDQRLTAQRNVTLQAAQGSMSISGSKQNIGSNTGTVSITGGDGADETVTVTASERQRIYTPFNVGGDVLIKGGRGDRSTVRIVATGGNVAAEGSSTPYQGVTEGQLLQARGNIVVQGGPGANSEAVVTTATASQLVRAGSKNESADLTRGNISVLGGDGPGAAARISNTGSGNQQIGESRISSGSPFIEFDFQSRDITVKGGTRDGAIAEVVTSGAQQFFSRNGTTRITGGDGAGATAKVESTSTTEQQIGLSDFVSGNRMSGLIVQGGTGAGSTALLNTPSAQRLTMNGTFTVAGGGTASTAAVTAASQAVRASGAVNVRGGTGDNATALLKSTGAQTVSFSNAITIEGNTGIGSSANMTAGGAQSLSFSTLAVTGGTGPGASAKLDSAVSQSLSGSLLTVKALGTTAAPAANASALVEAPSQTINSSVQLTGGVGMPGATSDAIIRTLTGNQSISGSTITMTSGTRDSTTMIVNAGTGTQFLNAFTQTTLTGVAGAEASAPVLIQNSPATTQSFCSFFSSTCFGIMGSVGLANNGAGLVAITSGGNQVFNTRSIDVSTTAGSAGTATIGSAGTQWIHTSNFSTTVPSMRVAALGTGKASVESASTQLLEVDYPDVMAPGATRLANLIIGDAAAAGNSLVKAVDQAVFAGSVTVQSGAGGTSKLAASGSQTISTVTGGLTMATSAPGAGATASIDPTSQSIVLAGTPALGGSITGNSGPVSVVSSGPQTLLVMNGPFNMTGASPASQATIVTTAPGSQQTVLAQGGFGIGPNASIGAGAENAVGSALTSAASSNQVLRTQKELDSALSRANGETDQDNSRRAQAQICR